VTFFNNTVTGTTNGYGVHFTSLLKGVVNDSTVTGNTGSGGMSLGGSSLEISGLEVTGNAGTGISVNPGSVAVISLTNASGNTGSGIFLDTVAGAEVSGVTTDDNSQDGLTLASSPGVVVLGHRSSGNAGAGLHATGSDYLNITGGTFADNEGEGVSLSGSSQASITGVTAVNNSHGLFLGYDVAGMKGSGSGSLRDNNASLNRQTGITLDRSPQNTLAGNTLAGNLVTGLQVTDSPDSTITGNTITGSGAEGVRLGGASGTNLSGNTISLSGTYGLFLADAPSNTVYNNYFNNTQNVGFSGTNTGNTWSVSPFAGTNIAGGPSIGGNYWGSPDLSGPSDLGVDLDGDGFNDQAYILPNGDTDASPLVLWMTPTGEWVILNTSNWLGTDGNRYFNIHVPGKYRLGINMTTAAETAIWVHVPGVVLNGWDKSISGDAGAGSYGVRVNGSVGNVQVRNLTVSGKGYGISYEGVTGGAIDQATLDGNRVGVSVTGGSADLTLSDLTIRGSSTAALSLDTVSNATLERVSAVDNPGAGAIITNSDDIVIRDSRFLSGTLGGIVASGGSGLSVLETNASLSSAGPGMSVNGTARVLVANSTATGNAGPGISMNGVSGAKITGTTASGNAGTGVMVSGGTGAEVAVVTVSGNGGDGLGLENTPGAVLTTVVADNNGLNGVRLFNAPGTTISGLVSRDNAVSGVNASYSGSLVINGGTFSGNTESGVALDHSPGATVRGVTATGSGSGIDLTASDGFTMSDNTVTGNDWGYYVGSSGGGTITGGSAVGNQVGIGLEGSSGNVINGTDASGSTLMGLYLNEGSDNNLVTGVHADNSRDGVVISNSAGNTVLSGTARGNTDHGVFLDRARSSNITGNDVTGSTYGVSVSDTDDSIIAGNTAGAGEYAFVTYGSSTGNTFLGNHATTSSAGFALLGVSGNFLSGNTAEDNDAGFYLSGAARTNLTGNNASGNDWGVLLDAAGSNTVLGNTLDNNTFGAGLTSGSSGNIFQKNRFTSSGYAGLYLDSSSGNTFADNAFVNVYNIHAKDSPGNTWNQTRSAGTNIIGGTVLGGNFYGAPDGFGFSEVTASDGTIASVPYEIGPGNTDYHPLARYPPAVLPAGEEEEEPAFVEFQSYYVQAPSQFQQQAMAPLTAPYSSSIAAETIPSTLAPGQQTAASITLYNDGSFAWNGKDNIALEFRLVDEDGNIVSGPLMMYLPKDASVAPGGSFKLDFALVAPQAAGKYRFVCRVVKASDEQVIPLGKTFEKPLTVGSAPSQEKTQEWSGTLSYQAGGMKHPVFTPLPTIITRQRISLGLTPVPVPETESVDGLRALVQPGAYPARKTADTRALGGGAA
jgi:parallel beta-helix repeat protein